MKEANMKSVRAQDLLGLFFLVLALLIVFITDCGRTAWRVEDVNAAVSSEYTPRNNLDLMTFNEAQPHLTFNDLAWFLDAFVYPRLTGYPADTTPPASPSEGDIYIVPTGATGSWLNQDGKVAQYRNASWEFYTPAVGWHLYKPTFSGEVWYDGSEWTETQVIPQIQATESAFIISSASQVKIYDGNALIGQDSPFRIYDPVPTAPSVWNSELEFYRNVEAGQGPEVYHELEMKMYNRSFIESTRISSWRSSYFTHDVNLKHGLVFDATDTPADPAAGKAIIWLDSNGDLKIKSTVGATTQTGTLYDYP